MSVTTITSSGFISRLNYRGNYGYIESAAGEIFFHESDLPAGIGFGEAIRELRVEFEQTETERGLRASAVRLAD